MQVVVNQGVDKGNNVMASAVKTKRNHPGRKGKGTSSNALIYNAEKKKSAKLSGDSHS